VIPPPTLTSEELQKEIKSLPWTGAGKRAVELFDKMQALNPTDQDIWMKLGLTLFDGRYYPQALEAFRRLSQLAAAAKDSAGEFVSLVWQGHLLDLLRRREEAVQSYKEALKKDTGQTMRHDQYGMAVNRQWVEERLKTPYHRK
jgi:tetratricopeptide (TPR) repeat protein